MNDVTVVVEGLGKRYRIGHERAAYDRLSEAISGALRAPFARRHGEHRKTSEWIWALRDVAFELHRGDVVGVIGRNGAGKTTLLKLLSRITEPSSGKIELTGHVAALLEVGTGFHPELTGRENVFLSGAVLGMRRAEIKRKFDEIVDFSGVEQFLDTPVKRYSSGMQVRLGFAVAAYLEPDILFIDEVLAVGDLAFQEKCLGKMNEVAGQGRTVMFVSHNVGAISALCPTSIWLDGGRVRMAGHTAEIVPEFVRDSTGGSTFGERTIDIDARLEAQVSRVRILAASGDIAPVGECSDPITIEIVMEIRRPLPGLYAYLEVRLPSGTTVLTSDSLDTDPNPLDDLAVGRHVVTATIPARTLAPGRYDVYLNLSSVSGHEFNIHSPGIVGSFRLNDSTSLRGNSRPGFFSTLLEWRSDPSEDA